MVSGVLSTSGALNAANALPLGNCPATTPDDQSAEK
jgi:hypothetical protein